MYLLADLEEAETRNVSGCLHGSGNNPSAQPRGDICFPEMATLFRGPTTPPSVLLQEGTTPHTPQGREKCGLVAAIIPDPEGYGFCHGDSLHPQKEVGEEVVVNSPG